MRGTIWRLSVRRGVALSLAALLLLPGPALASPGRAPSPEGRAGRTHAARPDFNNDSYADLAIGAPYDDLGSAYDTGEVNVIYGSSTGLTATNDQQWYQDTGGVQDVAEAGDTFGAALAIGDFNGDNYDDLAIGVPGEDIGNSADAGAINVLYGSGGGLTSTGNEFWSQDSPGIEGAAEAGDHFGSALAAGDFNGDGYADLAVGVPGEDIGVVADAGAVQVFYGGPGGFSATDEIWDQDSSGILGTAGAGDNFGTSLAAGEFNGDAIADLAIGVPNEDSLLFATVTNAGAVNVIYGSSIGLTSSGNQMWSQATLGIPGTAEAGDQFGYALAAGGFGGTVHGYGDLAIGVPNEDIGSVPDAGAVNVLYGGAGGLSATGSQEWDQDSPGLSGQAERGDRFGFALAAGDFDGNVIDDLAVGVPFEDSGSIVDAGSVNVIFGSSTGLASSGNQDWDQNVAGVADTAETGDNFGAALAAANFGKSNQEDLAIGVRYEDVSTLLGSITDAGAVHIMYGSSSGLTTAGNGLVHQATPNIEGVAEIYDYMGSAVAAR